MASPQVMVWPLTRRNAGNHKHLREVEPRPNRPRPQIAPSCSWGIETNRSSSRTVTEFSCFTTDADDRQQPPPPLARSPADSGAIRVTPLLRQAHGSGTIDTFRTGVGSPWGQNSGHPITRQPLGDQFWAACSISYRLVSFIPKAAAHRGSVPTDGDGEARHSDSLSDPSTSLHDKDDN